jgi:hypothetical protein
MSQAYKSNTTHHPPPHYHHTIIALADNFYNVRPEGQEDTTSCCLLTQTDAEYDVLENLKSRLVQRPS